ncbi:tandem-95 repeat protein [Anabaena minutissima FACHB-250]|nr:tandem-95 repeat protein [Anabaena minutissima FACHB-250]
MLDPILNPVVDSNGMLTGVFSVPGILGEYDLLDFHISNANTQSIHEFGVIKVGDALGSIQGITPDNSEYFQVAFTDSERYILMSGSPSIGSIYENFPVKAGEFLVFYITTNTSTDTVVSSDPTLPAKSMLFSTAIVQPDFDHLQVQNLDNGNVQLAWDQTPNSNDEIVFQVQADRQPTFAIVAEGTLTINGGGDFDGLPLDPSDDALIHTAQGFILNNTPVLPIQRDSNGNPILGDSAKPLLVDQALTVAAGYQFSNATNNPYDNLLPPQVVETPLVNIPAYASLQQQELNRRVPTGTPTLVFNVGSNPINNARDWNRKFPPPVTVTQPQVVRITNGGLTIPNGIDLSNYVIIVEQGDINFNGNGHDFTNVMLIANNGNINLGNVQASNLAIFASGSINMNSQARFSDFTLLAAGSTNSSINFNGATTNTQNNSNLWVISQGDIQFNGASDTRGALQSGRNIIFNGGATLYGKIEAKGNLTFNGTGSVVYAAISSPDTAPPIITANLARDTAPGGTTNSDRITFDPTITGKVTDNSVIVEFKAGLDDTPSTSYVDVQPNLAADGSFTFNRNRLEQIHDGTLLDGSYTLHLHAKDEYGNLSTLDFTFTLDTTLNVSLSLDPASDTAPVGDSQTTLSTVAIAGQTEPGVSLTLSTGATITSDAVGEFVFENVDLVLGDNVLQVQGVDVAGNQTTTELTIKRLPPPNQPPTIADITKTISEDSILTLSANDFIDAFIDVDSNSLSQVKITSLPSNGVLQLNGVAVIAEQEIPTNELDSLTFTPAPNFNGTVSFNWNASDGVAYASNAAIVVIAITAVNDAPIVSNISKLGSEDTVIIFNNTDFINAFSDVDRDPLTRIQITSLPSNGVLQLNGVAVVTGQEIPANELDSLTFTPAPDFNGTVSFNWNASDGSTYANTGALVSIAISPINDAPVLSNISKSGNEDAVITFTSADFTSAFSDVDGDSLNQIRINTLPSNGVLQLNGVAVVTGQEIPANELDSLTFTPAPDFNGTVSFNWNASDGSTYANTGALVSIAISPINDAPVLSNISKSGNEDTVITFTSADFTSAFSDVDGDSPSQIRINTLPNNGVLQLNGQAVATGQEIPANELDSLTFTPAPNFNGTVSFNWNASDGSTYANTSALVTIAIAPVNDAPVLSNINKSGNEDAVITFTSADFISAFSDVDGDSLNQIRINTLPSNGVLQLNGQAVVTGQEIPTSELNSLIFTPAPNFNGTVSFNWNASDGSTYANTGALVTIAITPVNDAPVISNISKSGNEDAVITFTSTDFISAFSDIDGDSLNQIRINTLPSNGVLQLNGQAVVTGQEIPVSELNNLTFAPAPDFNGTVSFNWNASDSSTYANADAVVSLTIGGFNDAPVISNINKSGNEDAVITFTSADFISAFSDVDGDSLSQIRITTLPSNGVLQLNGLEVVTGQEIPVSELDSLTFTPAPNFNGTVSFNWNAADGSTYANTGALVTIAIAPVNDAPVISNINKSGNEDTVITFTSADFTSAFSDVDGDSPSQIRINTLPNNGVLQLNGQAVATGQEIPANELDSLTFTPAPNFNGTVSFNWNASDGSTYANTSALVTIAIAPVNDAPVLSNINKSGNEDAVITFTSADFISAFSDVDGDSLNQIRINTLPSNGVLQLNGQAVVTGQEIPTSELNSLIFTPAPNFNGTVSFNWNASDGSTYANTGALVTIAISPVNDAPVLAPIENQTVAEGNKLRFTVTAADPDHNSLVFSVDSEAPTGVTIDSATGEFTWTPDETQGPGDYRITVQASDGSQESTATFTVTVTEVNAPPVLNAIGDRQIKLGETLTFTATATDPDVPANLLSFSLDTETAINATLDTTTGEFSWTPTEAGTFDITLRVTDNGTPSLSDSETIRLTVVRSNAAPTDLTISPTVTLENVPNGTQIGSFSTTDPNSRDTHTYSLVAGEGDTDNAVFSIIDNQLFIQTSPDFETKSTYTILVRATDQGGLFVERPITVTVLDVNEAPTDLQLSQNQVIENAASGTLVGTFASSDPDIPAQSFAYTLLNDADGRFAIVGGSNQLIVKNGNLLDFETTTTHTIRVRVTDSGTPTRSFERDFLINITNVNEVPSFTSTPIGTANAGNLYRYFITTSDPEGNSRTITANNLPDWLTLIDNGDGTAVLEGTPDFADAGIINVQLAVTETNTPEPLQAIQNVLISVDSLLQEQTDFSPNRSVDLVIPARPSILQFKITEIVFDITDSESINDAFEVALLDVQGNSLVHPISPGQDSFFNLTEGLSAATGAGTTYNPATQTVSLNLTGLPAGETATLVFRMVNNDSDTTSQVRIQDLIIVDAPPNTLSPVQTQFAPTATVPSTAIDFAGLEDVSSSLLAQYQRTTFNQDLGLLYADFNLENIGNYAVNTPLIVAVRAISDPTVQLWQPNGLTPEGLPYYNLTRLVADGKLNVGEISAGGTLVFFNPNQVQFTYDLVVLVALNRNPVITSEPEPEAIAGQNYQYVVAATDADGDIPTYQLLSAPPGMTIDPETGIITWATTSTDQGNYAITVAVSDGRGGLAEQSYSIAVTAAPPNRPPRFITNPLVDAFINQQYLYDADAVDPDKDAVNYTLILGPEGMTVHPDTGVVEWLPPPALILGDTVLGRITTPGQVKEFTFSGKAGQKVYFDPLQASGNQSDSWNFDVYTPSGNSLGSFKNPNLFILTEDGNYQIVVSLAGDRLGTYGFSVIDTNLAPVALFNTLITGNLTPGTEDDVYTFRANASQRLYFDRLSSSSTSLDWALYAPNNQLISNLQSFADFVVDLPITGEYILAIRGKANFGINIDYSFSIITGDVVTTPLDLNTIISSSIENKGELDNYTFTGTAGQQLFFDSLSSTNLRAYLYDPNGRLIWENQGHETRLDRGTNQGLILPVDGTYRLLISGGRDQDSYSVTGDYKFRLLDRAAATPVNLNEDIEGTFVEGALGSVGYSFSLSDRTYFYFDNQINNGGQWKLYNSTGKLVQSDNLNNNDSEFYLDAGDYFLVLQGAGTNSDYRLRLVTPPLTTTPMTVGDIVRSSLTQKGEQHTYTFTGTAGQQFFFDSLGADKLRAYLYDPLGKLLWTGQRGHDIQANRGPNLGLVLAIDGTYSLVIDGGTDQDNQALYIVNGSYNFRLLDRAAATPVNLNENIEDTFDEGGLGSIGYSFSLSDRTYLYVDYLVGNGTWTLYRGNGQQVISESLNQGDIEFYLDSGDYFLVVQGNGSSSNYGLSFNTPPFTTTSINVGDEIPGSITDKGQQNTYVFTGTIGQQIYLDDLTQNSSGLTVKLYTPTGLEMLSRGLQDSNLARPFTLMENGSYRLVVDATGENTNINYRFILLDLALATPISLGTEISGQLNSGRAVQFYQFTGTTGQQLRFDSLLTTSTNINDFWTLYDATGEILWNQSLSRDNDYTLTYDGTYFLAVRGSSNNLISYRFQIDELVAGTPNPPTGEPINFGSIVNGNIITAESRNNYTFIGEIGQQLFFDNLGDTNLPFQVYDPTGRELFNQNNLNDRRPDQGLTLAMSGTYRIFIGGSGTGSYSFRLFNFHDPAIPTASLNTNISGIWDNNGRGTVVYRLSLTHDKYLYIDAISGVGNWYIFNASYSAYGANNKIVSNDSLPNGDKTITLSAGEYFLVLQGGNNASNANYQIQLITPQQTVTPMTLGTIINGRIAENGEIDTYTFTGNAGQRLFYDNLGSNALTIDLYDPAGRLVLSTIANTDRGLDYSNNALLLTTNGTYRAVVRGSSDSGRVLTGDYKFQFLDWATATVVDLNVLNTDISGNLEANLPETFLYQFQVTERTYVYIDTIIGNGNWIIYSANGSKINDGGLLNDDKEFWLDAGQYYLAIQGNNSPSDTLYNLRLITPSLTTLPLELDEIISGSLTSKGQQNTYTFTGTAGQTLFYDSLGGAALIVELYDPAGDLVYRNADSRNDQGPNVSNNSLVLRHNGTYRVVIDGDKENIGNYVFRFLDLTNAPILPLNQDISSSFDSDVRGSTAYRLILTERQYLYFDAQGSNGNWSIYRVNGQQVELGDLLPNSDEEFWLDAGEYFLVLQGNGNLNNASYSFQIVTPKLTTTPYTLGEEIINRVIDTLGGQNTYTFNGTTGQRLFYDNLSNSPNIQVSLIAPSGKIVFSGLTSNNNRPAIVLEETGTYSLIVDGVEANTGNYSFRLLEYGKAFAQAVSQATPVNLGAEITGSVGLESDFYRFTAQAGQTIFIDAITGISGTANNLNNWYLYAPNGQRLISSISSDNPLNSDNQGNGKILLNRTGEYTLEVRNSGSTTRDYSFSLIAAPRLTTPYTLGYSVNSSIDKKGEQHTYTFTENIGQLLYFDALSGNANLKARLYSPTGKLLADKDTSGDWEPFWLQETGTYRLEIEGQGETTGAYGFILSDRSTAPVLSFDTPITDTLELGRSTKLYQIQGKKGQILKFDLNAATWSGANWVLYEPGGKAMATPSASNPDFQATLPADGLYTLAIRGNSSTPVSYSFQVTDLSVAPITASGLNTPQSGTLSAGQVIDYKFTANAGTAIYLDSLVGNQGVLYRLRNPDGSFLFTAQGSSVDRNPFFLPQTGEYTWQIYGQTTSSTGNYNFNLLELPANLRSPAANYLEFGSIVSSNLGNNETKVYTFESLDGLQVMFNMMTRTGNIQVELYDGSGNQIFSENTTNFPSLDSGPHILQSGFYHLVIRGGAALNNSYTFQLLKLNSAREIAYGVPVSGTLSPGQTSVFYKLEAQAGDRIFFDYISGTNWQFYSPGGDSFFSTGFPLNSDQEVTITANGTYYLYIQGGGNPGAINYRFRIFNYKSSPNDIVIPGEGELINNTDESLGRFSVQIGAEDGKGGQSIQSYQIRLWPDFDNTSPVIISDPKTRYALNTNGYYYQVEAFDADGDSLAYRLLDSPFGALINGDTGELFWLPDTTVQPGSQVEFTVEVSDRRGGTDIQKFTVDVYSNLGTIQGAVFEDVNRNTYRDITLIQGENPHIVFAIDVSGSAGQRTVDWTTTDFNQAFGGSYYTILDMELASVIALSEQLIRQGRGDTQIGVVLWDTSAYLLDMNPAQPGIQLYTTPIADNNNNGIPDIREVLNIVSPFGFTDFNPGLLGAKGVLDSLTDSQPNLIFMSDGNGYVDETLVANIRADNVNITAFGIGTGSNMRQIRKVDPNAIQINNVGDLLDIFSGWDTRYANEPFLENITVYLDLNNNSVLDEDEPWQLTQKNSSGIDETYYFIFEDLLPGTYSVQQIIPSGYIQTAPSTDGFVDTITLTEGESTFRHLFGLHKVAEPPNQNPVFISTSPTPTLGIGEVLIYKPLVQDPDADELTYNLPLAPEGMSVDPKTGVLVWTPQADQTGTFNIILRVQDGRGGLALQAFEAIVVPDNNSPIFVSELPVNVQPQVGKTFRYQAQAIDPDGDTLTYELLQSTTIGLQVDATTGLITWTPTAFQLGSQRFSIKVSDGRGGESIQNLDLFVIQAQPNQAPVITSNPRTTTRVGNAYVYEVFTTDPDGDALTYSLITAPAGMTIQDNLITWIPNAAQLGNNTIALRVTDSQGSSVNQSYTLQVAHQAPNSAPVITSAPNLFTNLEREYSYNLTGRDPDGDRLLWSLLQAPKGMVIDAITGALRWQPQSNQLGQHQIIVQLTDNYGLSTEQSYTLTVAGVNTPPVFLSTPVTQAGRNQQYTYTVVARDIENDPITYSLVRRPEGMTINQNGVIQWTPTVPGTYEIEVQAKDTQGGTAIQAFQIEVGTTAINRPPSITSAPALVADTNRSYTYQIIATDPDAGNVLRYELLQGAAGMTINPNTGLLTWDNPVLGVYQIVVAAKDEAGLGAIQGYTLTARANQAPIITSTAPNTAIAQTLYTYDVQVRDPDGDALTFTLDQTAQNLGITLDQRGRLRWTPTLEQIGSHTFTVTVTDAAGSSVEQTVEINVTADIIAPQVNLYYSGFSPADVGAVSGFWVQATDNVRVTNLELIIDGTPVALDSRGQASVRLTKAGQITAIARATDAAGNIGEDTFVITVIDPLNPPNAPDVDLDLDRLPTDIITGLTDIFGRVDDPDGDLEFYVLEVAPKGTEAWVEMFRGKAPVTTTDKLGTFDPSFLADGVYRMRLRAKDMTGLEVALETEVSVGGLKLGDFRISFTDMTVILGNVPVTIERTYDTLRLNERGDFGVGWSMNYRYTNLQTSLQEDPLFDLTGVATIGFRDGEKVYITLPGGKREVFEFAPTPDPINAYFPNPSAHLYRPAFRSVSGTGNTLTVQDTRLLRLDDGQYVSLSGIRYNPSDDSFGNRYFLRTTQRETYEINGTTGLIERITADGESVTFTRGGVRSSTGAEVTFARDTQGRIVQIFSPDGQQLRYTYDAIGNLVGVTDVGNNLTQFEYLPDQNRPHYLEGIIDPLNRPVMRNQYDPQGRVIGTRDANGQAITFTYDPANQLQNVTDPLGNTTTYIYDPAGNIVQQINPDGGIIQRTYDSRNRIVTEIDPLGHTFTYTYDNGDRITSETDALGNTTNYTYNQRGLLTSTIDPLGNVTRYTYDSNGNVRSVTNPDGSVNEIVAGSNSASIKFGGVTIVETVGPSDRPTQVSAQGTTTYFTYNAAGQVLTEKVIVNTPNGPVDAVIAYEYDSLGQVTKIIDPVNAVTQYEYNANGQLTAIIDPLNRRLEYVYDIAGNNTAIIYPDGTRETFVYDELGRVTAQTDRSGRVTKMVYDNMGRVREMILPDGTPDDDSDNPRLRMEYDLAGRVTAEIDPLGNRTEYTYDANGRKLTETNALGQVTTYTYDANGRLIKITDAANRDTRYIYDANGVLRETVFADGNRLVANQSNDTGLNRSVTDLNGNITRQEYNLAGQITAVTDALGRRTTYRYDELGNLIEQRDANGQLTKYEYDLAGRRTAMILPEGQRATYTYDIAGRLLTYTDFNNQVTTYTYTDNQQIANYTDGTQEVITFAPTGEILNVIGRYGDTTTYTYDARGLLIAETNNEGRTIQYEYDVIGRRTSVISPNATTSYEYDAIGRLVKIIDSLTGTTEYTYDAANNLIQTKLPNGTVEERTYDISDRLTSLTHKNADNQILLQQVYTRDAMGNILKIEENPGTINQRIIDYTYDQTYRLLSETITDSIGTFTTTYTYDAAGNRLSRTEDGFVTTYTYDANNRLLSVTKNGNTTTYTYDNNGNRLTEINPNGDTTLYQWDVLNQLERVTVIDSLGNVIYTERYEYNPFGIRTAVIDGNGIETRYLIDNSQPYAQVREEYLADGTVGTVYTHGLSAGPIATYQSGITYYYHGDHQGSVRFLTDSNGNLTDEYQYDTYGRVTKNIGDTDNSYQYAGEPYNAETGLQYLRARYLDVDNGQFLSRDPFEGVLQQPISRHSYQYANLNPVINTDPSGNFSLSELKTTQIIKEILLRYQTVSTYRRYITFMDVIESGFWWISFMQPVVLGIATLAIGGLISGNYQASGEATISISSKSKRPSEWFKGRAGIKEGEIELSLTQRFKQNSSYIGKVGLKFALKFNNAPGLAVSPSWDIDNQSFDLGFTGSQEFYKYDYPEQGNFKGYLFKSSLELEGKVNPNYSYKTGEFNTDAALSLNLKAAFGNTFKLKYSFFKIKVVPNNGNPRLKFEF